MNCPGSTSESVLRDTSYLGWGVLLMAVGLPFCWWYVSDGFEETAVVEPVHVFEGGVLDLVTVTPRRPLVDKFCLVQADHRLSQGVDAPIVKYCGSGGGGRALPGTVVCHDSLVDLAGEKPFEAADDVFFW